MKTSVEKTAQTLSAWLYWVEPWYLVYALLGVAVAGVIPILLPLVVGRNGAAAQVGWVMAAVSLGGLSAPGWGYLADRYRLHRWILIAGLLITALGLGAFAFTTRPLFWFMLALLLSIGAAGASTVANLFVVEAHPQKEWDERIGWLQTFYGVGQVLGLLLAGLLSTVSLNIGLLITAGLSGAAVLLGWLTTRSILLRPGAKPVLPRAARHAEGTIHSPQRFFHQTGRKGMEGLGRILRSRFGLFLAIWLLAFAGSAAVFSQYPLLMEKVFEIPPGISSIAFAGMAALGLLLYTPGGAWSNRYGSVSVLRASMIMRLIAFVFLFLMGLARFGPRGVLALVAFALVVLAWSLMSVSGTDLAARLSPLGEGEGMGAFNAVTAVAGVVGALLGGWAAGSWGYNATSIVAVAGLTPGLLLIFFVKERSKL